MKNKICEHSQRIFVGEGNKKPKNPHPRMVCSECKRRIKTGLISCSENTVGDGPLQWYLVLPRHKRKAWWKTLN